MPKRLGFHETTPQLRKSICKQASLGQPLSQIAYDFHCPLCTFKQLSRGELREVIMRTYHDQEGHQKSINRLSNTSTFLSYMTSRNPSLTSLTLSTLHYHLL